MEKNPITMITKMLINRTTMSLTVLLLIDEDGDAYVCISWKALASPQVISSDSTINVNKLLEL